MSRVGLQISIARGGACDAATHLGDDIGGKGSDGAGDQHAIQHVPWRWLGDKHSLDSLDIGLGSHFDLFTSSQRGIQSDGETALAHKSSRV